MTGMRTVGIVLLAALVVTGCGRRNFPVPPSPEGQEARPAALAPGPGGLARGPRVVPGTDTSAAPTEVQRNPNAPQRPFILDGLLN